MRDLSQHSSRTAAARTSKSATSWAAWWCEFPWLPRNVQATEKAVAAAQWQRGRPARMNYREVADLVNSIVSANREAYSNLVVDRLAPGKRDRRRRALHRKEMLALARAAVQPGLLAREQQDQDRDICPALGIAIEQRQPPCIGNREGPDLPPLPGARIAFTGWRLPATEKPWLRSIPTRPSTKLCRMPQRAPG